MILDYLEELHGLHTIDDVWSFHVDRMSEFGFSRLLYGYTRFQTEKSFGEREDLLLLTNHCVEYLRDFVDNGLYSDAPMVKWAAANVGARSWSWVTDNYDSLTKEERNIIEFNQSMDVIAGYSIGFQGVTSRSKGAIGLVAQSGTTQKEVDHLWAEKGREILQMNNVAHMKMTTFPFPTLRRPLTDRQRETLEWVGDGKTMQDIATIMGLTKPTIEKHLRLARESLDVETTAQAVLKASYQNQIYLLTK